nr:hypothetical protein Iba_chr04aCG22930 [Ipomoea batatas]
MVSGIAYKSCPNSSHSSSGYKVAEDSTPTKPLFTVSASSVIFSTFYSSSSVTGAVTIGMRGRPGTRRIKTLVFFGINAASSRYSVIIWALVTTRSKSVPLPKCLDSNIFSFKFRTEIK